MTHAEQAPARIWVMTHVCFDAPQEGATEYVRVDIPREQVAAAIMRCSLATGHGDTLEDLLGEMVPQVIELMNKIGACRRALIAMVDRWGPGTEGADRRMWVEACRALGRFTPHAEDEIASALPSVYRWEREAQRPPLLSVRNVGDSSASCARCSPTAVGTDGSVRNAAGRATGRE